jgi:N-methylhydantoinase B
MLSRPAGKSVDAVTVATIWHYLQRVCRDMRHTMERTASNVLATSLHDLAYGIWDAKARVIAIPEGFPCRLISSTYPVKAVLKKYGSNIHPGDVFLTNHPFIAGAVHLPDWVFIQPVFYLGELVFFTCMGTHVPDNGGAQAGTHFLAADGIAEGLNIPPVKIVENGKIREDVWDLILCNNRLPDMMRREMHSLIGSTSLADQMLVELMNKYGKSTVLRSLEEMIARTERAVRAEISRWPDGTYYAEAQIDDDGANLDVPVTVRCELTVKVDEITFDFSKSDKQSSGNINAVYSVTQSDTFCATFLFLGTELSEYHNEGSLRPVHVVTEKGTIVDARPGALTASTPGTTGSMIIECVFSLLSQVLPHRAIASYARLAGVGMMIGKDPRSGELYIYSTFCPPGGAGAVYGYDGYQCCCDMATLGVATKTDAEEEMVRFPWRIRRYEFITDSAGAGKWRGAPGIWWEAENLGEECRTIGGAHNGWLVAGQGQQGGQPTPLSRTYIKRGNDIIPIKNPHVIQHLKTGDILVSEGGGGAGVGSPLERDPEAVLDDVRNEIVSIAAARDIYKVVIDPSNLTIDDKQTQNLRSRNKSRNGRKKLAKK